MAVTNIARAPKLQSTLDPALAAEVLDKLGRLIATDARTYKLNDVAQIAWAGVRGDRSPALAAWVKRRSLACLDARDRVLQARSRQQAPSPADLVLCKQIADVSVSPGGRL